MFVLFAGNEAGAEVQAVAVVGATAGAEAGALFTNFPGIQEPMMGVEIGQDRRVKSAGTLLLGDVGEAVIAIFFTSLIKLMSIPWKVDRRKIKLLSILLRVTWGITIPRVAGLRKYVIIS